MSGDETNALSLEQQHKPGKPMKLTNPQIDPSSLFRRYRRSGFAHDEPQGAHAAPITEEETHAIAVDAYFFLSANSSILTRPEAICG
jgi:hypothetical protein